MKNDNKKISVSISIVLIAAFAVIIACLMTIPKGPGGNKKPGEKSEKTLEEDLAEMTETAAKSPLMQYEVTENVEKTQKEFKKRREEEQTKATEESTISDTDVTSSSSAKDKKAKEYFEAEKKIRKEEEDVAKEAYTHFTDKVASYAEKNDIFYSRSNDYITLELDENTSESFNNTFIEIGDMNALKDYVKYTVWDYKEFKDDDLKPFTIGDNKDNYIYTVKMKDNSIQYYIYASYFADGKYYTQILLVDHTGEETDIDGLLKKGGIIE